MVSQVTNELPCKWSMVMLTFTSYKLFQKNSELGDNLKSVRGLDSAA